MPAAIPLISAGVGAAGSILGAKKSAAGAKAAAQATETRPFSSSSPFGTANFNQANRTFDLNAANNPFSRLFQTGGLQGLANAYSAPGSAYYGAPPEVIQALQQAGNSDAEMQNRLDLLRQQAAPGNNQAALSLKDKLFSLGQLGSTSGAAGQEALLNAANQQDLGFQQTAADWANQRAQQRFQNAFNTVGQASGLAGQQFNQGLQSSAGIGDIFQRLLQQGNLGVAAGGGQAPGAAVNAANAAGVPLQAGLGLLQQAIPAMASWGNKKTVQPVPAEPGNASGGWA